MKCFNIVYLFPLLVRFDPMCMYIVKLGGEKDSEPWTVIVVSDRTQQGRGSGRGELQERAAVIEAAGCGHRTSCSSNKSPPPDAPSTPEQPVPQSSCRPSRRFLAPSPHPLPVPQAARIAPYSRDSPGTSEVILSSSTLLPEPSDSLPSEKDYKFYGNIIMAL